LSILLSAFEIHGSYGIIKYPGSYNLSNSGGEKEAPRRVQLLRHDLLHGSSNYWYRYTWSRFFSWAAGPYMAAYFSRHLFDSLWFAYRGNWQYLYPVAPTRLPLLIALHPPCWVALAGSMVRQSLSIRCLVSWQR